LVWFALALIENIFVCTSLNLNGAASWEICNVCQFHLAAVKKQSEKF